VARARRPALVAFLGGRALPGGTGARRAGRSRRWTLAAIALSRPVPVLAEAVMADAAAAGVPARQALPVAVAAALPVAVVFAALGERLL